MVFTKQVVTFLMCFIVILCSATIKLEDGGQSFSSAIKAFYYHTVGNEVTLFEKQFSEPGYLTEQWFTSSMNGPFDEYARIRVYVDGENDAAEFNVTLAVAFDQRSEGKAKPWSNRLFGRLANGGGFFNTFRFPFTTGIRITLTNEVTTGYLWYIVRGLVGVSLMVGTFELPSTSRLRVYNTDKDLDPFEFVTLASVSKKSGMLFLVMFDVKSEQPTFMEGCVRAVVDNSNETQFLSSGMEDFFLSAFYFNDGPYQSFQSGLTFKSETGSNTSIVAYKFFFDDPVLFRKSFKLIWRNNEMADGETGCPSHFPSNMKGKSAPVNYSAKLQRGAFNAIPPAKAHLKSYVWVYEW